jgi:hypothetical protein
MVSSTKEVLRCCVGPVFCRFFGGTNLDPATDPHVHGGTIVIKGDRLENVWDVFAMGKKGDPNRFFLTRVSQ